MPECRYFTTPIYYASGQAHAGHLYTTTLMQVLKEHNLSLGRQVTTLTGMDEHGEKIAEKATAKGVTPQKFVDQLAEKWSQTWKELGLSFDVFMRTSSAEHKKNVQEIFQYCYDKGDIYFGEHSGRYCVDCEDFLTEKEMDSEQRCLIHGRPTELRTEGNYYFRTTKYREQIREAVKSGRLVRNKRYANELLGLLDALDSELSISRPKTRTQWGIELPFDSDHVSYVWFDALPNYVTGVGGIEKARNEPLWKNATHIIGKDILKFHGVFWPAMLLSLDLPLPQLLIHGWLLQGGEKMSKSKGNAVTIDLLRDTLNKDAFVNGVFRLVNPGEDLEISASLLVERYNADLANGVGNLLSRTLGLAAKAFDGEFPDLSQVKDSGWSEQEATLKDQAEGCVVAVSEALEEAKTADALQSIWRLISTTDKYITENKPWELVRKSGTDAESKQAARRVLGVSCAVVRTVGYLSYPFFPEKMSDLLASVGEDLSDRGSFYERAADFLAATPGRRLSKRSPLFPRLEIVETEDSTSGSAVSPGSSALPAEKAKSNSPKAGKTISFKDFARVSVRVGLVEKVEIVEGSDKLLRLEICLGEDDNLQVFSGIRKWVKPEELAGRKVLVVSNLEPRKMRFGVSEGMVLSTESGDGTVRPVIVDDSLDVGAELA